MQTLVKVRMLDARLGHLKGSIVEFTPQFARDLVNAKGAEYLDVPKSQPFPKGRGTRDKMIREAATLKG